MFRKWVFVADIRDVTLEHTEQVRVIKVDSCIIWNCRQLPWQRKITSRKPSEVPALSPRKFQSVRALFGHYQICQTQVEYKREHTNLPDNKKLKQMQYWQILFNVSSVNKPTEGERNRTKLNARIKHSMLMFTRISVNKNNSFYNSDGQKTALKQK